MTSENLDEKAIFNIARQIGSLDARAEYLRQACGADSGLRERVQDLLRAYEEQASFLESPPPVGVAPTIDQPASESPGAVIGPYKLIEQIGEGGMGTVWMAQQTEPVKRVVALKLIKVGMDSKQVIARFEAERQALALMEHPNIARVLGAGTTDAGRPYFVMDLVKGVPITKYCDEHHLTPRQRLELFLPVCQAVQHAHQKGIIHRDLKPSNVLVALYDGKSVPKVIDFGVAKATGQQLTDKTLVTGFGNIVGTLEYMSPEQAEVNQLDIDTRSDIYSLGVLLYELLAGSPPFSRKDLEKAGMLEMLRVIREDEPSKPSTKLSSSEALPTLSANRGTEPAKLTRLVRGDLDWIVMKALEKDRSRRYETANGFAMDVQRYLADEAVQACPPSAGYRLKKFLRRNKRPVIAVSLILACLVAGIIGTSAGLVWAVHARAAETAQRQIADAEKKKAEKAEDDTLADYRASTDDAIEQLIGSKPDLGPQEKTYLERTLKRWQTFAERQGDDERSRAIRAEGHHRVAYVWQTLGRRDEALKEYETALDLRRQLVADFPAVPEYQQQLAAIHNNVGLLLHGLGRRDAARTEYETSRDLLKKLAADFPTLPQYQYDLASAHNNLGKLLSELNQRDAACIEYETSRDLYRKLLAAFPDWPLYRRRLASTHNNLGALLKNRGQHKAGRTEYDSALDLQKKLVADYPDVPRYQQDLARTHTNLAVLLADLHQCDAARKEFETALDLQKKLAADFPAMPEYQEGLGSAHNGLATVLTDLGQREAARTEYETARGLLKKLATAFPAVPEYRHRLATIHYNLGLLLVDLRQRDAARTEYQRARDLYQKLAADFPAVPDYQYHLANTHYNLAKLLTDIADRDAARREYETACDLYQKLSAAFPAMPQYQRQLAGLHNDLGLLLNSLGERQAARTEYEAARNLRERLAAAFPAVVEHQVDLGGLYCNLGKLVNDEGQPGESLHWYDLAVRTLTPVYEKDRRNVTAKLFLRNSHVNRALAYDQLKRHAEAVKDWDKVVELSSGPQQSWYRANRAYSRLQAEQVADAVAEVEELTKAPKWSADQWYNFACVYAVASAEVAAMKQQYADRAMQLLRQAVEAGFQDTAQMAKDADLDARRRAEDFKKLIAEWEAKKK